LSTHRVLPFTATATVVFPKLAEYLEPILASIATHDMKVTPQGDGYVVESAFGHAVLEPRPQQLFIRIETPDLHGLNRIKHALTGPIGFIAARERLVIRWNGDEAGLMPLEDLRVLRVVRAYSLTPNMRRIVLQGENLAHFSRIDQLHCRLIFAPRGPAVPDWPMLDDHGRIVWPGARMPTRVYTLRHVDVGRNELTIDFALHASAGPATAWALAACPGDCVGMVGPAAGGLKPASFYVFVGDESALPGIARLLESLCSEARGLVFIEVQNAAEELALVKPNEVQLHWLHRAGRPAGTTSLLVDAVRTIEWPADLRGVFFWGGVEHKAFREIHHFIKYTVGLTAQQRVFYSHWHRTLSEEQIIEIGGDAYLAE
jgi:NADPH-dependent ferric siderophore reductase